MTLGDILQAARDKKGKTVNTKRNSLARMIMAARETGRTNRDVFDMLTDAEMASVFDFFTTSRALSSPTRSVWLRGGNTIDRKIDCIKTVRSLGIAPGEYTGTIGLKEAKDFVEGSQCLMLNESQIRYLDSYLRSNFPLVWTSY